MSIQRDLIPTPWTAPYNPQVIQYVVVNWLYREVDPRAEVKMPVLVAIHGFRNIEVFGYLKDTAEDRERRTCLHVYGAA